MSVVKKQIERLINQASIESLKSGKVLDLNRISELIKDKLTALDGGPTITLRRQQTRKQINLPAYNDTLQEAKFDIDTLYEIIAEKAAELLQRFNSVDVSYKSQRTQLNAIRAAVNDLLFSIDNTDDYFFGVFDNFASLDKTDLISTSKGAVDLAEGVVSLPFSMPSAKRLDLSYLYDRVGSSIVTTANDGSSASGRTGSGTKYGYVFSDVTGTWRYDVVSKSKEGVKVQFTVPLMADMSIAHITRVEIGTFANMGMSVEMRHSLDNKNFTQFQNAQAVDVATDVEKVAWDFPETQARYLRVIMSKNAPDSRVKTETTDDSVLGIQSTSGDEWTYSFSVSNIAVYRLGRTQDAIFQSKPLIPKDSPELPIFKISLTANQNIMPRTSIDYSIALANKTGDIATEFLPIAPRNSQSSDAPSTIFFGEHTVDNVNFSIASGDIAVANLVTARKVDHYPIHQLDATKEYKFGANKLYRGGNVFSRTSNSREIIRSVSDNNIDFSDGSKVKQLYRFTTETARVFARNIGTTIVKSFLGVTGPIARSIRPSRDSVLDPDPSTDLGPDYAVASVAHTRSIMAISDAAITPTGTPVSVNGIPIPVAPAWLGSTTSESSYGVPILRNGRPVDIKPSSVVLKYIDGAFTHTFREGLDYSIKRSDDDYFTNFTAWSATPLHWRIVPAEPTYINIESGSPLTGQYGDTGTFLLTGATLPPYTIGGVSMAGTDTLYISYDIDPDITHRVESVSYDSNEIQLDGLVELMPGDSILVTYKKVPSNLVRDSIVVTQKPGRTDPGTVFLEGADYSVNTSNGTITMNAGGAINALPTPSVYVDYSFRDSVVETQSFSVWCYYDSREPLKFQYNPLNLRTGSNETLYWKAAGANDIKRIDSQQSITLTKGWHQFSVVSLNPDTFSDAAIYKVLKLRDIENRYLFLRKSRGGSIFQDITAYRVPMRQVTFAFLKNATLKSNHSSFAIDTDNQIYVNFPPGSTSELFMQRITSAGVIENQDAEEFIFEGLRKLSTSTGAENPGYIVLRAHLTRSPTSDGGVTAKIYSYNIRVSYS